MGFVGEVMDGVKGIQLYYTIGILLFVALFIVVLIRTIMMPKSELVEMKTTIFEKDEMDIEHSNSKRSE